MDILSTMVLIPSVLCGLIFGWLFGRIFIKITENRRFCLTSIGTKIFGKKTKLNSQFVSGIKGTLLVILDLVIIAVVIGAIEYYVGKIVYAHPVFYFPFTLFVLTLLYNLIRKTTKISLGEWLILAIFYIGSVMAMWGLLSYW